MPVPEAQPPVPAGGAHLVLYDGVCGLCSRLLQFVLRHDHRAVFRFAALQSRFGRTMVARSGGDPDELSSFCVFPDFQSGRRRLLVRSDAALFVAGELGWPWKAAQSMRFVPKWIRDRVYDAIAGTRYQLFGRSDRCLVPRPEFRSRFIEWEE